MFMMAVGTLRKGDLAQFYITAGTDGSSVGYYRTVFGSSNPTDVIVESGTLIYLYDSGGAKWLEISGGDLADVDDMLVYVNGVEHTLALDLFQERWLAAGSFGFVNGVTYEIGITGLPF